MELIIIIVVTVGAALVGGLIWPMYGNRIHKPVANMLRASDDDQVIQRVLDFYLDRIDHEERVSPSFLRFYLDSPDHRVSSINQLPQQCCIAQKPIHILLYVRIGDQIVGASKLIYICELESFFIAYYAAKPVENVSSTDILSTMMNYISPYLGKKHNLYYEICVSCDNMHHHIAKERLFRHYAESRGFVVSTLVENYLQPEISAFEGNFVEPLKAKLFVLAKERDNFKKFDCTTVVDAIFKSVYLDSFSNLCPEYKDEYSSYLTCVKNKMGIDSQK